MKHLKTYIKERTNHKLPENNLDELLSTILFGMLKSA